MIGTFLKRIAQFISILALQVLVFNHVQIVGYATPMVCIYFILLFPLGTPHWQTLLWAFAIGLLQDIFSNTPGMNAASLTFVGFIQPMLSPISQKSGLVTLHTLHVYRSYHTASPFLSAGIIFILQPARNGH